MTETAPIELTVVIDSVVRMREQQLWPHPDLLEFALAAENAGVDGVLLGLHVPHVTVRDRDWRMLERLRRARLWPKVAGAGAAVTAGLVFAVTVLLFLQSPVDSLPRMDDVELAAAQDAELLDELEFLAWMVALEEPDDIPKSG